MRLSSPSSMKVKILLFPLALVVALAMGIFWIKPEISAILTLRKELDGAEAKLAQINGVLSNIDTLNQSLDENVGNETFVGTYLPATESDQRILDEVNFLAGESGLLLFSADVDHVASELIQNVQASVQEAQMQAELGQSTPGAILPVASSVTLPQFVASSPKEQVRSVDVVLSVFGKYDQIKTFLDRVYHSNHFQRFLKIEVGEKLVTGTTQMPDSGSAETLESKITVRFGYLPAVKVAPGTFLASFNTDQFDFTTVRNLRERVTKEIPPLQVSPAARSNPFLR